MIISKTPLRVSFFGGGTDFAAYYHNSKFGFGCVDSTAINKYIYITVNQKFDDLIRVCYSKNEMVDCVDKIEHNIIREALKITGIEHGVEIIYMGDIPLASAGIGLASSSAIAVGVLNALYAYKGQSISAERLAREACEIEINRLGNPIGKQDQYAVSYGGFNYYQFNQDDTVFVNPIICNRDTKSRLESQLMFFYTGITRISSAILEEQNQNIISRSSELDQLTQIALDARKLLSDNDINSWGELLDQSWQLKKKLAGRITSPEIDFMYERAKEAGAVGGKIVGAGGGGFLLLYVPVEKQEMVKKALHNYRQIDMKFEMQGSRIIYVSE